MKKGFTLIELVAVITLLGLLSLIVVPVVDKLIKQSEENLYKTQVENIEEATRNYYANNIFDLPENNGDSINRTICELELLGLIEPDLKNPKTDKFFYKDSYVKITKTNYGYEYNYIDSGSLEVCSVCEGVTEATVGNVPTGEYNIGDEYLCKVKPGTEYRFFIVSSDEDNVNLIMDSNINSDGEAVNKELENKGLVSWINYRDYVEAGGTTEDWNNDGSTDYEWGNSAKGPITAMNYLNNATSDWSFIPNLNENYKVEFVSNVLGAPDINVSLTGKARLLKKDEVKPLIGEECINNYPWLITNLDTPGIENLDGVYGYWTLYLYSNRDAIDIDYDCTDTNYTENILVNGTRTELTVDGLALDYYSGVRPVITIPKYLIKN